MVKYSKKIIPFCLSVILLFSIYHLFHIQDLLLYCMQFFLPFFIALFIHFLLDPLINYFSKNAHSRKMIVVYLYIIFAFFLFIFLSLFLPFCIEESLYFYNEYSKNARSIHPFIINIYDFMNQKGMIDDLILIFNQWTKTFFKWGTHLFFAYGISYYLSYDNIHVLENLINLIPFSYQGIYRKYLKQLKLTTYAFIKSLFLDFLCFFLLCLISFYFIDSSSFLVISLFLSFTNLIPYIGPYLGGIPVIIFEYINNSYYGLLSFFIIVILQYLESSFLQPYLFQKYIKIHPLGLFFALSLFGDLFGIIGMILSPLLFAYLMTFISLIKERKIISKFILYLKKITEEL